MAVIRFKLPFGKMPSQFNDVEVEQWQDYCAVTDVNSDKPDEIVLVDLNLTGLTKTNATKVAGVSEATKFDMEDMEVGVYSKRGLPAFKPTAAQKL
jgi:hypothetical protein